MNDRMNWNLLLNAPGFANAQVPRDYFYFFDDFIESHFSATADISAWFVSDTGSGTVVGLEGTDNTPAQAGGIALVTTDATTDDLVNMQVNGEAFHLKVGYPLYFECRFNLTDIDKVSAFVGLALGGEVNFIASEPADFIGFKFASSKLYADWAESASGGTAVDCAITETDLRWMTVSIEYDGGNNIDMCVSEADGVKHLVKQLHPAVDTNRGITSADAVPDDVMLTPMIELVTENAAAEVMWVDYVFCAQKRYKV